MTEANDIDTEGEKDCVDTDMPGVRQPATGYPLVDPPRKKRRGQRIDSLRNWTNCGFPERNVKRRNRRYVHPLAKPRD